MSDSENEFLGSPTPTSHSHSHSQSQNPNLNLNLNLNLGLEGCCLVPTLNRFAGPHSLVGETGHNLALTNKIVCRSGTPSAAMDRKTQYHYCSQTNEERPRPKGFCSCPQVVPVPITPSWTLDTCLNLGGPFPEPSNSRRAPDHLISCSPP
ncbi:hypothetical protein V6N13_144036 [Hibiscus sabdariffa]|uniref:Uncharacterized protein n=1 Tax=Hibiscus sabdariffa TaxID=183260 RepID=A0ABR2FJE1_9ROSI